MQLIIDDREHAICKILRDGKTNAPEYKIQRLLHGDFAIVCNGIVVAIIERKTIQDYAASFTDGRRANKDTLLAYCREHKCDLYYFIEGKMPNDRTQKVSKISIGSIITSIMNLTVRDHIYVYRTTNIDDSIETLSDMLHSYTLGAAPCTSTGGDDMDIQVSARESETLDTPAVVSDVSTSAALAVLTQKRPQKTAVEVAHEMRLCIPGIGVKRAKQFEMHSPLDMLDGKCKFVTDCTADLAAAIIACTPGISKKGATKILNDAVELLASEGEDCEYIDALKLLSSETDIDKKLIGKAVRIKLRNALFGGTP
jgi:ERCC4-type nuclease